MARRPRGRAALGGGGTVLGFNVSVSGIRVGLRRLDVSAHNVANVTTPGFKASRVDAVDLRHGGSGVGAVRVNFNSGPIEINEGGFSLAIEGDGFFRVQTPQGERYTRAGSFGFDAAGNIVTSEGYILLPNVQIPPEAQSLMVSPDGVISALMGDGQVVPIGQVTMARFPNAGGLRHEGANVASATSASGPAIDGVPGQGGFGRLVFGALEGSNVDLASEIVSQIVSSASVKANVASLRAKNEAIGTILDIRR